MTNKDSSEKADIQIPGFRLRHQIELQATDWSGVSQFLAWLESERGNIKSVRFREIAGGLFDASITVENVLSAGLREYLRKPGHITSSRLEHLFIRDEEARGR